jgi:hypothetical protein
MITRGQNSQPQPLNIVGSSVFGRYPKISIEKTYNMFESQGFMVPYAGYQIAVSSAQFLNGKVGRGIFTSTKLNRLVVVIDANVYLVNISFSQPNLDVTSFNATLIGQLQTVSGIVYIAENNKPQIGISDGTSFYIYDTTLNPSIQVIPLNFRPGYLTFHDTYFILAASDDQTYSPPANNTWRLSNENDGTMWLSTASSVGLLQSKPDNVQAVVRFPSKGNLIFVMGSITTEAWYDTGSQQFPYTRTNQFNIDYGCVSPATVAYMDEKVVWLAQNEKSGPIILVSDGGMPKKLTTDGIDFLFSTLTNPQDSQAFIYRQDGHMFYHINFYTDNLSLFYDFNTDKFYHASDEDLNYFIAAEIAFFNNQYYFITRNNGNLFAFDTAFYTYQDVDAGGHQLYHEIPRIRICKNIRSPSQDYFVVNDIGFTIESGETDYLQQSVGPMIVSTQCSKDFGHLFLISQDRQCLITQNGLFLITERFIHEGCTPITIQGTIFFLVTQDGQYIITQDELYLVSQQTAPTEEDACMTIRTQQDAFIYLTPRVDISISYDGGASFGNEWGYELNPIGQRRNRLMWWQGGLCNDLVCQFRFWSMGRFVCSDGVVNIRT